MNYPDDIRSHRHDPRSPDYLPTWREEVDGAFLAEDLEDLRRLFDETAQDIDEVRQEYAARKIAVLTTN